MLRVLGFLFLVGVIVLAVGGLLGWFSVTKVEGRDRSTVGLTINKDAVRQDTEDVKGKIKGIGKEVIDEAELEKRLVAADATVRGHVVRVEGDRRIEIREPSGDTKVLVIIGHPEVYV